MTETPIAAPPSAPPSRSRLVTASGIVVAILPIALIATALVMRFDAAPVLSTFTRGDLGGIISTALFVGMFALATFGGIAIVNRWRGWRYYAGTLGWLLVVLACLLVNDYVGSLDVELFFASTSYPPAMLPVAIPLALLGIFLIVAKRGEPPSRPARPVTAIGIVVIVFGLAVLAGNVAIMILSPDRAIGLAVPAVIGGLIVAMGYGIARRGAGWRIYTGALAWFLIFVGAALGVVQFPSPSAPRFAAHLCLLATAVATCIALGWFILWSKRREPRAALASQQA